MTPPPPDASQSALMRIADELQGLRERMAGMEQRLGHLLQQNTTLQQRLDASEAARSDLLAQTEHLVRLLDTSRQELRKLWAQAKA
ncbi:MAG: hypothetical protein JNN13_15195 [Planctomycetes bacterium]|nr:hypothetical protein [Planctomycetota bacterium]